jgi:hypothetical protein
MKMADAKRKGTSLAAKVADVRAVSKKLAEKTAEMNATLESAEKLARSLAGGIPVEADISDDDDALNNVEVFLIFRRGKGDWRLHIEQRDVGPHDVWTLDDAPRWARLKATEGLPKFFAKLHSTIEGQVQRIQAAIDGAAFVLGADAGYGGTGDGDGFGDPFGSGDGSGHGSPDDFGGDDEDVPF